MAYLMADGYQQSVKVVLFNNNDALRESFPIDRESLDALAPDTAEILMRSTHLFLVYNIYRYVFRQSLSCGRPERFSDIMLDIFSFTNERRRRPLRLEERVRREMAFGILLLFV